jgi:hypothetical protein
MDGNGFELFGIEPDIFALAHLLTLDDVVLRHLSASTLRYLIRLPVSLLS